MTVAAASPSARAPQRLAAQVALAGLAGGAVDFAYASGMALSRGRPWTRPWDVVASGWIGPAAREGGALVTTLGVVTHFGIAAAMAAAYLLVARRVPVVTVRPWSTAPVYGLVLYGIMYFGVLPLRFGNPWRWQGVNSILDIAAHVGVALAIVAVAARRRPQ